MPKTVKEEKINLEQSFKQLEKITEELQSENLDLEKALEKFETGLELAENLKKRLAEIENKMETIKIKHRSILKEDTETGDDIKP